MEKFDLVTEHCSMPSDSLLASQSNATWGCSTLGVHQCFVCGLCAGHIYPFVIAPCIFRTSLNCFELGIVVNIVYCRAVLCISYINSPSLLQENAMLQDPVIA